MLLGKKAWQPIITLRETGQNSCSLRSKNRWSGFIAAAKGLMMAVDQDMLTESGGYMSFSKSWRHSLLHRMGYVQRKPTPQRAK